LVRCQDGSVEDGFGCGDRAYGPKAVATDDDGVGVGRCMLDDPAVQRFGRDSRLVARQAARGAWITSNPAASY